MTNRKRKSIRKHSQQQHQQQQSGLNEIFFRFTFDLFYNHIFNAEGKANVLEMQYVWAMKMLFFFFFFRSKKRCKSCHCQFQAPMVFTIWTNNNWKSNKCTISRWISGLFRNSRNGCCYCCGFISFFSVFWCFLFV